MEEVGKGFDVWFERDNVTVEVDGPGIMDDVRDTNKLESKSYMKLGFSFFSNVPHCI